MLKALDKLGAFLKMEPPKVIEQAIDLTIKYPILLWDSQLYRYDFNPQMKAIENLEKFICQVLQRVGKALKVLH